MSVIISEDFRRMTIPSTDKILGCVGDIKIRNVHFVMPRYCDDTDMMGYRIQVHYENAKGTGDYTEITDISTGSDIIEFVWTPPVLACEAVGVVVVNVKTRLDDGGIIRKEFNSGFGKFKVKDAFDKDPHGSPLVDSDGDLIVLTLPDEE